MKFNQMIVSIYYVAIIVFIILKKVQVSNGKTMYDILYSFKQQPDKFNENKIVGSGLA